MAVEITLNGTTKTYELEKAKKYFKKEYEECDNLYSQKAQKICYVLAFLNSGKSEKINADKYYYC